MQMRSLGAVFVWDKGLLLAVPGSTVSHHMTKSDTSWRSAIISKPDLRNLALPIRKRTYFDVREISCILGGVPGRSYHSYLKTTIYG